MSDSTEATSATQATATATSVNGVLYPAQILEDLAGSGIGPGDIRARLLGSAEKAATGAPMGAEGYVIPYFGLDGKPIPFYRVKLFDCGDMRYKQLANTPNHIYFPPGLAQLLAAGKPKFFMLTEGEKKAACAVKNGYPCAAVSGVDSWRNRTLQMPGDSQLGTNSKKDIIVKLGPGKQVQEKVDTMATGLAELIDYLVARNIPLIIVYDSDVEVGPKGPQTKVPHEVARAAAVLGYTLRHKGMRTINIRSMILTSPTLDSRTKKLGLDDFIVNEYGDHNQGVDAFEALILANLKQRSAFPKHPNVRDYVNRKLSRTHLSREDNQALVTAMLCDLDAKGQRLICPDDDNLYYFDSVNHKLLRVVWPTDMNWGKSPFGTKLYRDYNVSQSDLKVLQWMSAMFPADEPITEVYPDRVLAIKGDTLYYQLGDGHMARVNADGIKMLDNGTDDVLFESGMVEEMNPAQLELALHEMSQKPLVSFWFETLKDARIKTVDGDKSRKLLALLYSISPWFYKWRNAELPIEMTLGEAGSGKSTLYTLRQNILNGRPELRNSPNDLRDWVASIASTGGLHVTDNVHMTDSKLRQSLSDELCRIVTATNPSIEKRKLYTDNDIIRVPVKCVFAITAITQPFVNVDIIQRSIITELDKGVDDVSYDGDWGATQLARFGGRPYWVANQLLFQRRLFELIRLKWTPNYKARFRLINMEQLLMLAAEVYGWDGSWIPNFLEQQRDTKTSETDFALEGIQAWAAKMRDTWGAKVEARRFPAREICDWASAQEDFEKCTIFSSARTLGNYMNKHKNMVASLAGVEPKGVSGNAVVYGLRALKPGNGATQN